MKESIKEIKNNEKVKKICIWIFNEKLEDITDCIKF